MQFALTEEQLAVQKTARDFATAEVLPKAAEVTARFVLPPSSLAWTMLRQEGLLGEGPPPSELVLRRALPASGPSRPG